MRKAKKFSSLFDFYANYKDCFCEHDLNKSLRESFKESTRVLESSHTDILNELECLLQEQSENLKKEVMCIDHVGFMGPAGTTVELLETLARQTNFNALIRSFPSKVLSQELGAKLGKESVPTTIFTARNSNGQGVEIFIADETPLIIERWVEESVGVHLALRVHSDASIYRIIDLMEMKSIALKPFMKGKPMANIQEKSLIAYFGMELHDRIITIECKFY